MSIICLLAAWLVGATLLADDAVMPISAVSDLKPEALRQSKRVRIQGVVTYYRPHGIPDMIVQDESGGIFLNTSQYAQPAPIRPGLVVDVSGVAVEGTFSPRIDVDQIVVLGDGEMPTAQQVGYDELRSGRSDCRYIEIAGVVRSATLDSKLQPERLLLRIATSSGSFDAWVLRFGPENGRRLVDAAVRVRGVCLAWDNSRRQIRNLRVLVSDVDSVLVDRLPDEDPFASPLVTPDSLFRYRPEGIKLHRVRLRGTVTLWKPGEFVVLESQSVGIRAAAKQIDPLTVGDDIEVVGFPGLLAYSAEIQDAMYRVLRPGIAPGPVTVTAVELFNVAGTVDLDQKLVRTSGTLRMIEPLGEELALHLEQDGKAFVASLPATGVSPSRWTIGDRLELTGICQIRLSERIERVGGAPDQFSLLLRGAQDVQVLSSGPWLTRERMAYALIIACGLLAGVAGWTLLLRREVSRRTSQLVGEVLARHESALEQRAVADERGRLAVELHDTLEQTLTGAALQLQAESLARIAATAPSTGNGETKYNALPDGDDHLSLAKALIDRSRRELRVAVADLRRTSHEQVDLIAELNGLSLGMAGSAGPALGVAVEGEPRLIPQATAHHLVRIAQESVANALKHARARQVRIELLFNPGQLTLRVIDDGRGFFPDRAPGPADGHFGQQSLRDRAAKIDAQLSVYSSAKAGTTVEVVVPLRPDVH